MPACHGSVSRAVARSTSVRRPLVNQLGKLLLGTISMVWRAALYAKSKNSKKPLVPRKAYDKSCSAEADRCSPPQDFFRATQFQIDFAQTVLPAATQRGIHCNFRESGQILPQPIRNKFRKDADVCSGVDQSVCHRGPPGRVDMQHDQWPMNPLTNDRWKSHGSKAPHDDRVGWQDVAKVN